MTILISCNMTYVFSIPLKHGVMAVTHNLLDLSR